MSDNKASTIAATAVRHFTSSPAANCGPAPEKWGQINISSHRVGFMPFAKMLI